MLSSSVSYHFVGLFLFQPALIVESLCLAAYQPFLGHIMPKEVSFAIVWRKSLTIANLRAAAPTGSHAESLGQPAE